MPKKIFLNAGYASRFALRRFRVRIRALPAGSGVQLMTLLFVAFVISGCTTEPFQRPPLPVLPNADPDSVRMQFPQMVPDEFTSDDTLILKFPFHDDLAMLGVLNVNRTAGTFELYGLNQVGLQYFHLSGNRSRVAVTDAIGPWMQHKEILLSIASDMQRIYFDLSPDAGATVQIKSTEIVFNQVSSQGTLIYQFGMQPIVLFEKQMSGFLGTTWRARYYDYRPGTGGKLFPHGIVMDNFQFHYRLIIKNRDWSIDEKE